MAKCEVVGYSPTKDGDVQSFWGYPAVGKDGKYYVEIPEKMVAGEVQAGRVREPLKARQTNEKTKEVPEATKEVTPEVVPTGEK